MAVGRRPRVLVGGAGKPLGGELVEDLAAAHRRVLQVRAGVALEGERLVEVEREDAIAPLAGHLVAQRPDRDGAGAPGELFGRGSGPLTLALGDRRLRLADEGHEERVGLDPDPAPPGHLDERLCHVLRTQVEVESLGRLEAPHGGRRKRHHLVGEVDRAVGSLRVAEDADRLLDHLLGVGLAHVDDVVDASSRRRTPRRPDARRDPRWSGRACVPRHRSAPVRQGPA